MGLTVLFSYIYVIILSANPPAPSASSLCFPYVSKENKKMNPQIHQHANLIEIFSQLRFPFLDDPSLLTKS